jgi:XTP/dITP diphosphohydrolase
LTSSSSAAEGLGIETPPETGATFLDNALSRRAMPPAPALRRLADDSGIEVDALGGRPACWSARFAGEGASDAENLAKLLREMAVRAGGASRCALSLRDRLPAHAGGPAPVIASGSWEGHIPSAPRGTGGFGYDPIFQPAGLALAVAELPAQEKNRISHRAQALRALLAALP